MLLPVAWGVKARAIQRTVTQSDLFLHSTFHVAPFMRGLTWQLTQWLNIRSYIGGKMDTVLAPFFRHHFSVVAK